MGVVQRKLKLAGAPIAFDFGAPSMLLSKHEYELMEKADYKGREVEQATRAMIIAAVGAAFPQMKKREDSKIWAAWLEVLNDDPSTAEVTRGMVDWLRQVVARDDLPVIPPHAQWREALVDYLDTLAEPVPVGQNAG
jgi:hypothetical protein